MIALRKNMTWAAVYLLSLMRMAAVMPLLSALASPATAQPQNQAPAIRSCPLPNQAELDLDSILGYVSKKVPDARVVTLISVCHAGFTLGPSQIESLTAAGASKPILDALDRDTLSRLSLAQARRDVEALESRIQTNLASANGELDALLRRSDADYNAQREKAAHLDKSEFETTGQYQTRIAQATAAADRNHDADQSRITERFRADLERKNKPLESRAATLKTGLFRLSGSAPTWIRYDADASTLTVGIDGEEFWFSLAAARAQGLKTRWSSVILKQAYEEADSGVRYLVDSSGQSPISGRARLVIEKEQRQRRITEALNNAQTLFRAQRYEEAKTEYENILSGDMDPGNQTAKEGLAASIRANGEIRQQQAEIAQKAEELAAIRRNLSSNPKSIPNTWYDASTYILWTEKDNGKNVTWVAANGYCQSLSYGNFRDWRLASVKELRSIYDPSVTKYTKVTVKSILNSRINPLAPDTQPQALPYHIKGDMTLSEPFSWSADGVGQEHMAFLFVNGSQQRYKESAGSDGRALCVRVMDNSRAASESPNAPVNLPSGSRESGADHTLKLTSRAPSAERTATIVAPGNGLQSYNLYYIDARDFPNGGVLDIEIQIAPNSSTDGSFDLFSSDADISKSGRPANSLAGRYDVRKGTSTHLSYRFKSGEAFVLGLEGNWFSPKGNSGVVHFRASVLGSR